MKANLKRSLLIGLSVLSLTFGSFGLASCRDSENPTGSSSGSSSGGDVTADSMFEGEETQYVLTENYVLSDADVNATGGSDKTVVLDYVCSFDLGGNTLDLNGYTLQIVSQEEGCLIEFESGTIANGTLDISVPNGDITFDGANLADNVVYELEAASSTIRFSNARVSGNGKVKSESRIEIEYSAVQSITLEGNGTLNAGNGASLGNVSVSENASGASVNISSKATVGEMAISAAANVAIEGEVSSVKVNENVKATDDVKVTVADSAKVDKVELKSAATVEVAGTVGNVTVSETAANSEKAVEVNVASTAKVQKLDVQAAADVNVEGEVSNVVVNEKATGTNVNVSGDRALVANIVVNSEDVKIESENAESISKVVVAETVKDKVEVSETVTEKVETATEDEMKELLKHEHFYVRTVVTLPSCEEEGSALRVCDCGDTVEEALPATGHDYKYTINVLPSETEAGEKTFTCRNCGDKYTETIAALGVKLDSVAELIGAWIGDGTYSIVMEEGSEVTLVRNSFDVEAENWKGFYTLELAEAVIDVTDGYPMGYIKIVASYAVVYADGSVDLDGYVVPKEDRQKVFEFYAYLDGETCYVDVVLNDQDFNAMMDSDSLFSTIFGYGATSLDDFFTLIDVCDKLVAYLEMYDSSFEAMIEDLKDSGVDMNVVLGLFAEYYLSVEEQDNGDVVYSLSLAKISEKIEELGASTVEALIDKAYGNGATEAILDAFKNLPDMKLKDFANGVFEIAENYSLDVDTIFDSVESAIYGLYGAEIDVQTALESFYEYTFAELIVQMVGEVYDEELEDYRAMTVADVRESFEETYEMISVFVSNYTLDQLFNLFSFGNADYIPEEAEDVYSISAYIKSFVDMMDAQTECIVTIDANGDFKSFLVSLEGLFSAEYKDNEYALSVTQGEFSVSLNGTIRQETDQATLVIKNGEETLYSGEISLNLEAMTFEGLVKMADQILLEIITDINDEDGDHSFDGYFGYGDFTFDLDASEEEGNVSAILKNGENELFSAELETTEEGAVLVVKYAGVEVVKFDVLGTELKNSETEITIPGEDTEIVLNISIEELEEGVYKIVYTMPNPAVMAYMFEAELTVSVTETDEAYSVEMDMYVTSEDFVNLDKDKDILFVDGTLTYVASKNAEGNVHALTLKADIDKFLCTIEDDYYYENAFEGYAKIKGSITVDLESESKIDKEEVDDAADGFDVFNGMDFRVKDGNYEYYLTYVEAENGGYYEVGEIRTWYNLYDDGEGSEYRGTMSQETYSAIIPAVNGVPQLTTFMYQPDCGDWTYIRYNYQDEVTYTYVRTEGTFTVNEDGEYELVSAEYTDSYSDTEYGWISGDGYYNVKTKVTVKESQHNYVYSAVLLNGAEDCEGGMKVTRTCNNCNDEYVFNYYGCYEVETETVMDTQCGELYVEEYACAYCGMGWLDYNYHNHSWDNYNDETITDSDLTALGLDATGFYYGYVEFYHCYWCGLDRQDYRYYTYTAAEGCLAHEYVAFDYKGNEDYAAGTLNGYAVNYGHHTSATGTELSNALINEVEEAIGYKLPFTVTSGYKTTWACGGCGHVDDIYINLYSNDESHIEYHESYSYYEGSWHFENEYYYLYDVEYVAERMGEYALENATYGRAYVRLNKNGEEAYFDLELRDSSKNSTEIWGNKGEWTVTQYDYANCWEVRTELYFDADGNVLLEKTTEEEWHRYSHSIVNGASCTEDGIREVCDSCGETIYEYNYHSSNYWVDGNLSTDAKYLTKYPDRLGEANVSGYRCGYCNKMHDITIVLQANWTLTGDVYLYAEDIIIDFNGYTLDLNGYNFIVYSFNGSKIVFTDNDYDTSDPNANAYSVVDKVGGGYFVAFNNGGDIDIGTIALDVDYFLSDTDNRDTIEESFYWDWGETLDGYYYL